MELPLAVAPPRHDAGLGIHERRTERGAEACHPVANLRGGRLVAALRGEVADEADRAVREQVVPGVLVAVGDVVPPVHGTVSRMLVGRAEGDARERVLEDGVAVHVHAEQVVGGAHERGIPLLRVAGLPAQARARGDHVRGRGVDPLAALFAGALRVVRILPVDLAVGVLRAHGGVGLVDEHPADQGERRVVEVGGEVEQIRLVLDCKVRVAGEVDVVAHRHRRAVDREAAEVVAAEAVPLRVLREVLARGGVRRDLGKDGEAQADAPRALLGAEHEQRAAVVQADVLRVRAEVEEAKVEAGELLALEQALEAVRPALRGLDADMSEVGEVHDHRKPPDAARDLERLAGARVRVVAGLDLHRVLELRLGPDRRRRGLDHEAHLPERALERGAVLRLEREVERAVVDGREREGDLVRRGGEAGLAGGLREPLRRNGRRAFRLLPLRRPRREERRRLLRDAVERGNERALRGLEEVVGVLVVPAAAAGVDAEEREARVAPAEGDGEVGGLVGRPGVLVVEFHFRS